MTGREDTMVVYAAGNSWQRDEQAHGYNDCVEDKWTSGLSQEKRHSETSSILEDIDWHSEREESRQLIPPLTVVARPQHSTARTA